MAVDDAPEGTGGRRWFRRPGPVVAMIAALVVAVGGPLFLRAWSDRGAREVSTTDVIERYRAEEGVEGATGFLRPPAGVYTFNGDGEERLSLLDTGQPWGPTMPATVTHDDECWTLRIDYNTNHWQEQRLCPTESTLLDDGGRTFQQFDFVAMQVSDVNVISCEQPAVRIRIDAEPGDQWEQRCTGRSESMGTQVVSEGTTTFVGLEEIEVDGEMLGALHYRMQRTLTGDQNGTEDTHHWYSVTDAMLLRASAEISVVSPSPLGDVTYTEHGEFQLRAREPAT